MRADRKKYFREYYRKIRRPRQIANGQIRERKTPEPSIVISIKVPLTTKALWRDVQEDSGAKHLSTFIREVVDFYVQDVTEYTENQRTVNS